MTLELGVYSFGNTPRAGDGYGATAQAIRDALEAVKLAEEVGLDFFGFGEHHTRSMPLSSPTAMVNAAAAIAPGRIEAVAGRGSSNLTFSLFDLDKRDYDMLFSSKLELLLALNASDSVTWSGPHRRRPSRRCAGRPAAGAAVANLAGQRRQP
jgi:alkanesulfonate monooxygenase SsuD/methylene tetrahydromethanopterin reductase-like flavin-dependent oxidoreductase (luciferase family)